MWRRKNKKRTMNRELCVCMFFFIMAPLTHTQYHIDFSVSAKFNPKSWKFISSCHSCWMTKKICIYVPSEMQSIKSRLNIEKVKILATKEINFNEFESCTGLKIVYLCIMAFRWKSEWWTKISEIISHRWCDTRLRSLLLLLLVLFCFNVEMFCVQAV